MTSFKLFLISRIRNLFGTAAKNIQLFLSLPRKGKNVIARLLNSIKTPSIRKGFGFLAFYIQTPMLTLFCARLTKVMVSTKLNCINSLGELIDYSRVKAADYILG